jgi:aconitate hydratase
MPLSGWDVDNSIFAAPLADGSRVKVAVDPASKRLQLLEPFAAWDGKDYVDCPVLIKALGKCTTDHISMAGPWLKYRGHLTNISDNCLIGAVNAETKETNAVTSQLTGKVGKVPDVGREYREAGIKWIVVGDQNYGEGSSREHAALEPRHLGGVAVLVRSFARIHETNLKKQGMLPLTFAEPSDYDKITGNDKLSVLGLAGLSEGVPLKVKVTPGNGSAAFEIVANHTFNAEQIGWFKAGSALNMMKNAMKASGPTPVQ